MRPRTKAWHAREELRDKGQFWTPKWVARAMARYVSMDGGPIFDAGVGAGAFAAALRDVRPTWRLKDCYLGAETDPEALPQAHSAGLSPDDLAGVCQNDFTQLRHIGSAKGIISNPPYIRHHRLDDREKSRLRSLAASESGLMIDGRAGLHVYFLIHALHLLPEDGRLAFIVPSDVVEGVFAPSLWNWIASRFNIEACVRFAPSATPFPGVDTNPIILLIRRQSPKSQFLQAIVHSPGTDALEEWVENGMPVGSYEYITAMEHPIDEAVRRGLGRDLHEELGNCVPLSQFARTLRGIATGANDFFFLNEQSIKDFGLPKEHFVRAVGKTTDVTGDVFEPEHLDVLSKMGRPTWLLSLPGIGSHRFTPEVRQYVLHGEEQGLPERALIAQRKPWYKMEKRTPPAFLFTYLGRRSARFVRNDAGVVPLTGFICVYPLDNEPANLRKLWRVLSDARTVANLKHVGKTYGSGALKVEPKSLANLPIPLEVLEEHGFPEGEGLDLN